MKLRQRPRRALLLQRLKAGGITERNRPEFLAKEKAWKMSIAHKIVNCAHLFLTICLRCAKMIAEVEFLWV